jgi:hypothetical protein
MLYTDTDNKTHVQFRTVSSHPNIYTRLSLEVFLLIVSEARTLEDLRRLYVEAADFIRPESRPKAMAAAGGA